MRFLFLLCLTVATAQAEDFTFDSKAGVAIPKFVGELKILKGEAIRIADGKETSAAVGTLFYQNDTVKTGTKSFVQIQVYDETKLNLGPDTVVQFEHFKFKNKNERQVIFNFLKGQLRAWIKNVAKEGDIQFKTKSAIMGVRGTELLINHQTLGPIEVSDFALLSGKVNIIQDGLPVTNLAQFDHLTVLRDLKQNNGTTEKGALQAKELEYLMTEETFLTPFEAKELRDGSVFKPWFDKNSVGERPTHDTPLPTPIKSREKGSFEGLRELNEQLENEHKKRSGV